MLSKFVKVAPTAFTIAFRRSRKQNIQLFYRSVYSFSTNPNENLKPQKKLETDTKETTRGATQSDGNAETFVDYMQEPETNPTTNYVYTSKEIFSIKTQYQSFAARQRGDFLITTLMLSAGVVSYIYIHPAAVIVPAYFMAGSVASFFAARKMSKTLCKSMELMNTTFVKLRMLSGEELVCKIEEIQVLGIKEWNPVKKTADPVNSYIVLGYFKDVHSKVPKEVRFIVDRKVTKIENIDLFRAIMHTDKKELEKFEFKEGDKPSKDSTKTKFQFDFTEEELNKLEEEVQTKKKEKK